MYHNQFANSHSHNTDPTVFHETGIGLREWFKPNQSPSGKDFTDEYPGTVLVEDQTAITRELT
jgi:hypothetical protein